MPAAPEPAVWGVAGSTNLRSKRSGTAKRKRSKPDYLNTQHAARPAAKKLKRPAATHVSSEDKADQADQAWQQKPGLHDHSELTGPATNYSSPDSASHDDASPSYYEYRSRLTADLRHRCVRVSENARGAQCLAIATGKKSHSGVLIQVKECACLAAALFQCGLALIILNATSDASFLRAAVAPIHAVWMQDKMLEHVLCVPMVFASEDADSSWHIVYVCTCSDMASRVESIISRCTTKMNYSGKNLAVALLLFVQFDERVCSMCRLSSSHYTMLACQCSKRSGTSRV